MAVANSITGKEFGNDKQILVAPELAFEIGVLVANTGISANAEGKKIIPAGTPIGGATNVLLNRQTVLTKGTSNAQGILLHDVDVTAGDTNATMVVAGYVDILKLDETTAADIQTAFGTSNKIILMKGLK